MTDHFAALSMPRRPWLDAELLKEKFHTLSTTVHPDRVHGAEETVKAQAGESYAVLNAAHQCLRDTKLRLQHLLLLETGSKPGDLRTIPEDLVQMFSQVAMLLRQTDGLMKEKAQAVSPMLKVALLERAMPHLGSISILQAAIDARRVELDDELRMLDVAWAGDISDLQTRDKALAGAQRLSHLFGFVDRWSGQLRERMIQLTM
jgi:DnaJ-domain-containing protein 1